MSRLSYCVVAFGLLTSSYFLPLKSLKIRSAKPVYLNVKLYDVEAIERGPSLVTKIGIGLGLGAAAYVGTPLVLAGAGFTATGIAGQSIAALWQSSIGNAITGTMFSALQSAGVIGLSVTSLTLVTAAGGAAGIIIAGGIKTSVPVIKLENVFKLFENDENVVPYDDIERMLKGLDLDLKEAELKAAYMEATGRTYKKSITYEEFLRLFGVRVLKGEQLKEKLKEVFDKCVGFSYTTEIPLYELGKALESLGINCSMKEIEDSYNYASESKNEKVTQEIFLKMCGFNVQKI